MINKKHIYLSFLCLIWSLVILGGNANADGWCEYNVKATEQCACGGRKNSKDYDAICQKGQYCRREIVEDRSKTSLTQSGIKYGNKFIYLCVTSEENKSDTVSICPTGGRKATSLCRCGNTLICQTGQSCIVDSSSKHICSGTSVAEQQAAAEIKKQEEAKAKALAIEAERQRVLALPSCQANALIKTECKCGGSSCNAGKYCKTSTTTINEDGYETEITSHKCVESLKVDHLDGKMENYYKNNKIEAQEVNQGVYDLIDQIKQEAGKPADDGDETTEDKVNKELSLWDKNKLRRVKNRLEKLAEYTGVEGADEFGRGGSADNKLRQLQRNLEKLSASGAINEEDQRLLMLYGEQLFQQGAQNALNALDAVDGGNNYKNTTKKREAIEKNIKEAAELVNGACPLVEALRAKYQSGCWSCLVVEKMTSAFMNAAERAYGLAQQAGIIVLKIGAVLWILLWGLRNVSSFTQLEPANILSELFKFLFKIMLAYLFIVSGLKMVGVYFINPIMGFGAKIAEAYWEKEEISPYTEAYEWDYITEEDSKDLDKNVEEAKKEAAENEKKQEETPDAEAKDAEFEAAKERAREAEKKFAKAPIPNFIVPPVFAGRLTSPAGCRMHPIKKTYTNHKGLDIAGNDGAKIVASGSGTISWKINRGDPNTGYGYYAIITHDNPDWVSIYAHMPVYAYKMVADGAKVVQGEVIGYVGNSGASTGPHLHFEIKHRGHQVDPLRLLSGQIKYIDGQCSSEADINAFPAGFYSGMSVPSSPQTAWTAQKEGIIDLTEYAEDGYTSSSVAMTSIPNIKYSGPTTIMSSAVMNSILGATEAIGNITSENMVLGDAIMCYATLEQGGANEKWLGVNVRMWLLGVFIFCTGLLLTIAFVFYLLDISFKIGFAVIAMPIVVGLWPFEITKDKFSACISIIAKSAALFAFLAMSTSFTVGMTNAVFNYEGEAEGADLAQKIDDGSTRGLAKLYAIFDSASKAEVGIQTNEAGEPEDNIKYATDKLGWFSTTFVLLLFAFLYSYKLVQNTGPDLVNKFFPDNVFGNEQPMHHLATAASKFVKDTAMKPIGLARDIALHQGGELMKKGASMAAGAVGGKLKQGASKVRSSLRDNSYNRGNGSSDNSASIGEK